MKTEQQSSLREKMITQTNLCIDLELPQLTQCVHVFSSRKRTSLKVLVTYEENFPLAFFVPPVLDVIKILVRKKTVFGM